jgi:hypothetical protein
VERFAVPIAMLMGTMTLTGVPAALAGFTVGAIVDALH